MGGADAAAWYHVGPEPIVVADLMERLADPAAGGQAVFLGVVRHEFMGRPTLGLEYEAYRPLALTEFDRIGSELIREFGLCRLVIVHRVGRLTIGETSVFVGASAPHRPAAFAACRAGIDRVKDRAPIFKAELWDDGSRRWHGTPDGPPVSPDV